MVRHIHFQFRVLNIKHLMWFNARLTFIDQIMWCSEHRAPNDALLCGVNWTLRRTPYYVVRVYFVLVIMGKSLKHQIHLK